MLISPPRLLLEMLAVYECFSEREITSNTTLDANEMP